MRTLADLQRALQGSVMHDGTEILRDIAATAEAPAPVRVAIYRDAYRIRLRDALGSNYPRLQQLLGADAFADIADAYLDRHPSRNPSVRWFGADLPAELASAFASQPWLAELAAWEWRIATAFDAADAPSLALAQLHQYTASEWPHLRFVFQPAVQRLDLRTNVVAIFKALGSGESVPSVTESTDASAWLIWRQDFATHYRSLPPDEAMAIDTLIADGTFGSMCTALCGWYAQERAALRAATLLKQWIEAEVISAATL